MASDFIFLVAANLASSILVGPITTAFGLVGAFINQLFGL